MGPVSLAPVADGGRHPAGQHEHGAPAPGRQAEQGETGDHGAGGVGPLAVSATLHCLTGCAVGEIAGLMIGSAGRGTP